MKQSIEQLLKKYKEQLQENEQYNSPAALSVCKTLRDIIADLESLSKKT